MEYEDGSDYSISRALDGGEEEDIKRELCAYIDDGNYNPRIKDFINAVSWLDDDAGKDYSKEIDIMQESKKHFECSMQKRVESFKKNEAVSFNYNDAEDFVKAHNKMSAITDVVSTMCVSAGHEARKLGLDSMSGPDYTRSVNKIIENTIHNPGYTKVLDNAFYVMVSDFLREKFRPSGK